MVEYSPINVIRKDLVSTFFGKDLKCLKFSRLQYMYTATWFSAGASMGPDWFGNVIPGTDTLRIRHTILL